MRTTQAANETRTAILDLAQDLTQKKSLTGFSFQEIAKGVGIKKGSLYYHFETKDQLAVAMLERAGENLSFFLKSNLAETALRQLELYFSIFSEKFGAGKKMCPGGALVGVWDSLNPEVQKSVQNLVNIHIRELSRIVETGVKSGEFVRSEMLPEERAIWIFSSVQGASLVSRGMENAQHFHITMQQVIAALQKK